jgi:hypothetical protein
MKKYLESWSKTTENVKYYLVDQTASQGSGIIHNPIMNTKEVNPQDIKIGISQKSLKIVNTNIKLRKNR